MRDALKSSLHCDEEPRVCTTAGCVQTWVTARRDISTFVMHAEHKAA